MSLTKLSITGFKKTGTKGLSKVGAFKVQVNPSAIKLTKGVSYEEPKVMGQNGEQKFNKPQSKTLNFDIILDDTGVIPKEKGKENITIKDRIDQLEKVLYKINGELHEPNSLEIVWGSFLFEGRLTSLNYDYSLFRPDGSPLRVKVSLGFNGFEDETENKSPDLSRVVIVKAGENIPLLCQEYYDDASYCVEIARVNKLVNFRNVKPGTRLLFPPLGRNGRITE